VTDNRAPAQSGARMMDTKQTTRKATFGAETDDNAQRLADAALGIAWRGAQKYLGGRASEIEDKLVTAVRAAVKRDVHGALADARAAIDAGRAEIAVQTFVASMMLCGIAAAKEAVSVPTLYSEEVGQ
jgi:hypothetical protein